MKNSIIKDFLTSFFVLHGAFVKDYRVEGNKVLGTVGWNGEDDYQFFSWGIDLSESALIKIKLLCEFLAEHNLTDGDEIVTKSSNLRTLLQNSGWSKKEAADAVHNLCSISIKMIDDGEETDSFFIHF